MITTSEFETAYCKGFVDTTRFLISRGASAQDAPELSQAAWARGWEKRAQLRDAKVVSSWVNSIALNLLRSQSQRQRTTEIRDPKDPTVSASKIGAKIDVSRLLNKCDSKDQTLLWLQAAWGFTSTEVAQILGVTSVAVRVRMMRAKARIRKQVKQPLAAHCKARQSFLR